MYPHVNQANSIISLFVFQTHLAGNPQEFMHDYTDVCVFSRIYMHASLCPWMPLI